MPDKAVENGEFGPFRQNLVKTLAHHDSAIASLTARVGGVEANIKALETKVDDGFQKMMSKLDRADARPQFDLAKTVGTVLHLAVLLGMTVSAIIWVTTGQFGATVAEQKSLNAVVIQRLEKHDAALEKMHERIGWSATSAPAAKRNRD